MKYSACRVSGAALAAAIAIGAQEGRAATVASEDASTPATASPSATVGEVIVTARKRGEKLLDVPLADSAVSGQQLQQLDIRSLQGITKLIPNVYMDRVVAGPRVTIRGIGSAQIGGTTDPSVGVTIDGVPFSRPRWLSVGLFDLDSIEILRGPQTTFYGKDTTAGLINIRTRGPGPDLSGYVQGGYEFEHGGYDVEGAVGGPVSDKLGFRLAYQHLVDGGYLKVLGGGPDQPWERQDLVRLTLDWKPAPNVQLVNKFSFFDSQENGDNTEIGSCSAAFRAQLAAVHDPDDCTLNFVKSPSVQVPGGIVTGPFETTGRGYSDGLTATAQLGDFTLTSVSGFNQLSNYWSQDSAFSLVPDYNVARPESFQQFSEELRLQSPQDKRVSFVAGGYFDDGDRQMNQIMDAPAFGNISLHRILWMNTKDYAVFAEITGHVTSAFQIILGGRYTYVDQHGRMTQVGGPLGSLSDPAFAYDAHDKLFSHNFSPAVTLQYQFSRDIQAYASYKTGFKAGGFDLDGGVKPDGTFHYGDESATSYEIGAKASLLDRRLYLAADIFDTSPSNLQVESYGLNGPVAIILNAGAANMKGVEVEGAFQATRTLSANFSFGYTDARYTSFPFAPCTADETCAIAPGQAAPTQNLAGHVLPLAPRYTFAIGAEWSHALSAKYNLVIGADTTFRSAVYLGIENDPSELSKALELYNAHIGIEPIGRAGPGVALVGKNLLNTEYTTGAYPLTQTHSWGYNIGIPRTVEMQISYKF